MAEKLDQVMDEADSKPIEQQPPGVSFVRTALVYDVLDSSNDRAAELVADRTIALPLLVRAREQTRGRGRGSNTWWSDAGSLMFTLAIDPVAKGLRRELEPRLALTMAVAVVDAIRELWLGDDEAGIRWPNDIEARGLKLGGILPEIADTAQGRRVLIGVGLNVVTDLADAPADVARMATSLERMVGGRVQGWSLEELMWLVVGRFESELQRLVERDPSLPNRWMELDQLNGSWVAVDQGVRTVSGWARGIDAEGALLVEEASRVVKVFGGHVLRG
jgi:BirA family biotin operon repressor/biotin-[acetyl-CoA-carboxylase] ligase